jgi:hypothetical protein
MVTEIHEQTYEQTFVMIDKFFHVFGVLVGRNHSVEPRFD